MKETRWKKQPKMIKDENFFWRWIKAPFRFHDFDLENVQCINQGQLDKDVTGEPQILLYFVAFCKNCGAHVQVNRETYVVGEPPLYKRWFCVHNPAKYKLHLEQAQERAAEVMAMTPEQYQELDALLNNEMQGQVIINENGQWVNASSMRPATDEEMRAIQESIDWDKVYSDKRIKKPNEKS